MCMACYESYGSPGVRTPGVAKLVGLIARVYEFSPGGGNCHIVIDDFNIEDGDIDWVMTKAIPVDLVDVGPEAIAAERDCMELMRSLSLEERATALAIHDGLLK